MSGESGNNEDDGPFLQDFSHQLEHLDVPPPLPPVMNFDGTGPRLLITKIVNENFKSYYGRHVLGPFHKNFTSIVGPNGSGKSNVIDSLLFVFGYRAQKIRSKNISVLIHSSEQHRNVDYCSVEVHFVKIIDQTKEDFTEVPNSSFFIKRTAYKDNSSVYYVNKSRAQFKEIGVLLRKHGIDIDHNRFLILQGEVEQISLMKPKGQAEGEEGMLEYLEDIIGSSRLKPCIETLHKRMEELVELKNDKAQRAKVVEEEKAELEGPKDEAVAFLELENTITRKKNVLYQKYLLEATDSCSTMEGERDTMKQAMEEEAKKVRAVQDEIKTKQKESDEMKKKHDDLKEEADWFKAKFRTLEQEDKKLREDFKFRRENASTLEAKKEAETNKLNDLKLQPEKCEKELEELQQQCAELEAKRAEFEQKADEGLNKLQGETQVPQAEKRRLEEQLLARQATVAGAREKLELAKSELELCLRNQTREATKLNELKEKLVNVTTTIEERGSQITEAEKSIPEMEDNSRRIDRRLKDLLAEEKILREQVSEKAGRHGTAAATLQISRNRSRVLEALFNEQRTGRLKGIFGRLGDLGGIDEKYDVAISTACGPLDNIVVDTIDTAQKCVEFLTRNNIGMGTFIGLDKMARFERTMNQQFRGPENVPRLFDLIVVEDRRILPAFYYALRDTLVANDLDQATRVSFQGGRARYRVVTLSGEIIDISGTMSGGGTRQCRGRMGRSLGSTPNSDDLTPEQLKNLETEVTRLRAELDQKLQARLQLDEEKDKLGPTLQKKKLDLNTWKMDVRALHQQKQTLERQIQSQERILAATNPDEAEKGRLEKKIEKFQKDYDEVASVSAAIQEEVKKVDKVLHSISEKLVGSLEKESKECRKQIMDMQKTIQNAKVAVRTARRNVKNSEDKLAGIEEDIEKNKATIARNDERMKALETEAREVVMRRDTAVRASEALEEDLKEAKKAVATLEEQLLSLETDLMEHRNRVEHREQALRTLTQKKAYWERELRKLQLHDIRQLCGLPPASEQRPEPRIAQEKEPSQPRVKQEPRGEEEREAAEMEEEERQEEEGEDANELRQYPPEFLARTNQETVTIQLTVLEDRLKGMKPDLDVLNVYRMKEQKFQKILGQLDEITKMKDRYRNRYEELRKQRLNEFMDGFCIISTKLKEMYQMITLGGDADLELVDTMDPFTEGIAFSVRPPKKSWKHIANLSGGEKTLSSLSLVFALHHYKPTPLYVMDEIDAALDYKNVLIVANYIKERTRNAQFVIISLRNNMFELADRLIGIYKTCNSTKTVVINPGRICARPAEVPLVKLRPARAVLRDKASDSNVTLPVNLFIPADPEATFTDKVKLTPA